MNDLYTMVNGSMICIYGRVFFERNEWKICALLARAHNIVNEKMLLGHARSYIHFVSA